MVMERLARRRGVEWAHALPDPSSGRPAAVCGDYQDGGATVRLLMPLTMMNDSGDALRAVAADPAQVLIICDDVNLPLGAIRLRPQGSAGGHHGLQSCLEALGTEQVPRLRVGIGVEPLPADLEAFVLSPFRSDERLRIKQAIEQADAACEAWVTEGMERAMNRFNTTQDAS